MTTYYTTLYKGPGARHMGRAPQKQALVNSLFYLAAETGGCIGPDLHRYTSVLHLLAWRFSSLGVTRAFLPYDFPNPFPPVSLPMFKIYIKKWTRSLRNMSNVHLILLRIVIRLLPWLDIAAIMQYVTTIWQFIYRHIDTDKWEET